MPVTEPPPTTLSITLPVTVALPLKLTLKTVVVPLPPAILVKVLLVTVLTGEPPSESCHGLRVAVPARVIFEKLLPVDVSVTVAGELPLDMYSWTVPLAAGRLNVPTIALLFTVCTVLAAWVTLFDINVTVPVVFTLRLVNVLLVKLVFGLAALLMM